MTKKSNALYYALLWLIAIIFFVPIAWIMLASFKSDADILAVPPKLIFTPTLEQHTETIFGSGTGISNTLDYFRNSFLLSVGSVTGNHHLIFGRLCLLAL
jgi:multiple sugar transport system permease protein